VAPDLADDLERTLDAITHELEDERVASCRESWSKLLGTLHPERFAVGKDFAGQ
jgi:hypothetical protein